MAVKHLRWALCGSMMVAFATGSLGQQAPAKAPPPAAPAVPAAPAAQGLLADVARVVGMTKCRPVLERLAPMVSQDSQRADLLIDRNQAIQGESPVFLLVGMQRPVGSAALSISAVPEEDGSCSFAAERISMAPYTCESVAKAELQGYRATKLLDSFTVYNDPNDPGANVSMIDTPPGCIVIRRHVQFRWKPPAPPPPAPTR